MVKHIILWQLKDELTAEQKAEVKVGIKAGLEGLKGKIEGLTDVYVNIDCLPSSNADVMLDKDGNTVTAHSLNDVPLLHIANEPKQLEDGGRLCDIAPTILKLMNLDIPAEMTGKPLV